MASDGLGPDDLRTDNLPTARRGFDRKAVVRLMSDAAARWSQLRAEHEALLEHIEERGGIDNLTRDLREIGEHVSRMLGDAQEAAEDLRARAREEVAQRLAAAESRAAEIREAAEHDALKMRGDAWRAGSELLEQVRITAEAMIEQAEADVLITKAEAEQEAHRHIAEAQRRASTISRAARTEAERTAIEARRMAEEIVAEAHRKAEGVTADEAEPRGPRLRSVGWGVKVIESDEPVDPTPRRAADPHDPGYGDALAAEVERLRAEGSGESPPWHAGDLGEEGVVTEPSPQRAEPGGVEGVSGPAEPEPLDETPVVEVDAAHEIDEAPEEPGPVEEGAAPEPSEGGLLAELFDRLRTGVPAAVPDEQPEQPEVGDSEGEAVDEPPEADTPPVSEAIALRERLLLPIQNRGVREVRRHLVDLQNVALDGIRVLKRKRWSPDPKQLLEGLATALEPLVHDAAGAGAAASAEMTGGSSAAVIEARSAELIRTMAGQLVADLEGAVERGTPGGEVSSDVARVFRSWRNDAAERWVRTVAYAGYHDSLLAGLVAAGVGEVSGVRHGHLCSECPASSGDRWNPAGDPPPGTGLPPVHVDCTCTVAPLPWLVCEGPRES